MEKRLTRAAIRDRREDLEAEIDGLEYELSELQSECPHPRAAVDASGYCEDCGDWLHIDEIEERKKVPKRKKAKKKAK